MPLLLAACAVASARRLTPEDHGLPARHLPDTHKQRRLATTAPRVRYLVRTDPWDGWSTKAWTRLASSDVDDTPMARVEGTAPVL